MSLLRYDCLLIVCGTQDLPADSVTRFLREHAMLLAGHKHGSVAEGIPGTPGDARAFQDLCLLWGPLPREKAASALSEACSKTLTVVEAWEVHVYLWACMFLHRTSVNER